MPKNKGKGGKNRRRGKNDNEENKRDLEFKEEGQGAFFATSATFDTQKRRFLLIIAFNMKRICAGGSNARKWATRGLLF